MGQNKVFIGLPIYWDVNPLFFHSCLQAFGQLKEMAKELAPQGMVVPNIGDSAIGRSRNALTRQFLESDATHLLWIDSDLVFSAQHIIRIVNHPEEVVGGCYCKKQQGDPQLVVNTLDNAVGGTESGLAQVRYVGTGFMRIARSVFEKMIEAFGEEMWYKVDEQEVVEYDFWHMGVYKYPDGHRRWLSEDWWFCQKCADLGIPVYLDKHILLRHSGSVLFPLRDQEPKLLGGADPASADAGSQSLAPVSASA